jgi:hypothetical protein
VKKALLVPVLLGLWQHCYCWGFYAHHKINQHAVFLLPPEMMVLYKPHIRFLADHATDPDKRRYALPQEGARHFIDIDHYGHYPYPELPRSWEEAVQRYGEDSLQAHGVVPWWTQVMLRRLTRAFAERKQSEIVKLSAEIGHYIADAHVPLHATHNHNGQFTAQHGIHGFWESRIPELLAEREWNFFIGKATYIAKPSDYIWARVLESAAAADTVLGFEKQLSSSFPADKKWAFEARNNTIVRQYSADYAIAYNAALKGMVERRMRQSILAVASFWYTAWVNAGQPDLKNLLHQSFTPEDTSTFNLLNDRWKTTGADEEHGRRE